MASREPEGARALLAMLFGRGRKAAEQVLALSDSSLATRYSLTQRRRFRGELVVQRTSGTQPPRRGL